MRIIISRYFILVSTWLILMAPLVKADNLAGVPQLINIKKQTLFLTTINDGLGFESPDEWDDYRTYGFTLGFELSPLTIIMGLDSLTSRNIENYKRIDEISLGGLFNFFRDSEFLLEVQLGIIIKLYSDFGSFFVQKQFHDIFLVSRTLPETYDANLFLPSLFIQGSYSPPFYKNLIFNISALLAWKSLNYQIGILFSLPLKQHHFLLGMTYENHYFDENHLLGLIKSSESGFCFSAGISLGAFIIEKEINLNTYQPLGSISFSYPFKDTHDKASTLWAGFGTYKNLTNTLPPGFSLKLLYPLPVISNQLSLIFLFENGDEYEIREHQSLIRASRFCSGVDFHLLTHNQPFSISPYISLYGGVLSEKEVSLASYRSVALNQNISALFGAGLGLKLFNIDFLDQTYGLDAIFSWHFFSSPFMSPACPENWGTPLLRIMIIS